MTKARQEEQREENRQGRNKKNRKRGQGEGSIHKRKDGRWAAVINLGYQDGKLRRKYYYGQTRSEVAGMLTKALSDHQKGIPIASDLLTVKQFLESWLADTVKPSVRTSTYISYKQQVNNHIVPGIGHIKLSKLNPSHIQGYLNNRLKSKLSARTVNYHRRLLVIALGKAVKWGLVARNVAEIVDPPRTEKYEIDPISHEQARALLKAIEGDRLEALFTVALSLGLRRGEALGLRWSDIDFQARTLRINQSLQRLDGELQLCEPKTKSSRRVLNLPDSLLAKLRDHRTRQLEEKLQAGVAWQETGLVFTTKVGTPIDPRNVKRRFDSILKNAELPHYRIHDLRHFAASLMLVQGVPIKVVSEILGHSQTSTTTEIYTHVLPALRKEAIDLVDAILTGTK
jgi:integrase